MSVDWSVFWPSALANAIGAGIVVGVFQWVIEPRISRRLQAESEAHSRRLGEEAGYRDAIRELRRGLVDAHMQVQSLLINSDLMGLRLRQVGGELRFLLDALRVDAVYLDQVTIQDEVVKAHNAIVNVLNVGRVIGAELGNAENALVEARRLCNRAFRRSLGLYREDRQRRLDEAELSPSSTSDK